MLQQTKKLVSCFIIITLLIITAAPVIATDTVYGDVNAHGTINKYKTEKDIVYNIVYKKELKSVTNDAYMYTLYSLSPYGYAILFNATGGLMEACYQPDTIVPVDVYSDQIYYYGGPGIYLNVENGNFIDAKTNDIISNETIAEVKKTEFNAHTYELNKLQLSYESANSQTEVFLASANNAEQYSVAYDYFSNLVDYGINYDDTCTVIAAIMLLSYYDNFLDESYIAPQYEYGSGTNEAFHTLLNNYVYGDNPLGGIFIHDAATGINEYLETRVPHVYLEYSTTTSNAIQTMIEKLKNGEPVIASMGKNYGGLYNHSVLVYSVRYDSGLSANTAVFTMNMGWNSGTTEDGQPNTEYVASAAWFYECGYIAEEDHIYVMTGYNSSYHEYTCTVCEYTVQESHIFVATRSDAYTHDITCTICGYYEEQAHIMGVWYDVDSVYHEQKCRTCNHALRGKHSDYWNNTLNKCTRCGRGGNSGIIMRNELTPLKSYSLIK